MTGLGTVEVVAGTGEDQIPDPDHPPEPENFRARLAALWWLRGYAKPWSARIAVMFVAALIGVAASTLVPLVIEAIVNGPIKRGNSGELVPMFFAVFALGAGEALLIALRRYLQSVAVLSIEREMRDDFYAHLQKLTVSFHDRWGTGQLLSRATSDLSTIRRFFGFGAIYLVVNVAQYVAVIVLLIATYWPLGILVAAGTIPGDRAVEAVRRELLARVTPDAGPARRSRDARRGSRERDPRHQGVRPRAVADRRGSWTQPGWCAGPSSTWCSCSAGSGRC